MIAGLPGAGISALFYLICVVLMPFHALYRTLRGDLRAQGQWRLVLRQLVIGASIVVVLFAAGWLISMVIPQPVTPNGSGAGPSIARLAVDTGATFARIGLIAGLVTLATVVGTVRLIALLDRSGRRAYAASIARNPSSRR